MKMYPFPLIWLEFWSHTIKGMIEENSRKNKSDRYQVRYVARLDWLKTAKQFSANSRGKFLSWREAIRQVNKWILVFFSLRQLLFSLLSSYFNDICCTFHLGQMFIRFLLIIFDFYWSLALQFSCITVRLSDGIFLFPLASD